MSSSGNMDTQRRINHLQAMGVSQWHARFVLLGAAESPEIISVQTSVVQNPKAVQKLADEGGLDAVSEPVLVTEGAVGALLEGMSGTNFTPSSLKKEDKSATAEKMPEILVAASSESLPASVKPIPNVSLGAFVSGKYLVVSEIGEHASHLEEISLLKNILNVVDFNCPDFEFGGHFSWPVFKSEKVLVGQELLHEELLLRWLESFALSQSKVLMCFGHQAKQTMVRLFEGVSPKLASDSCIFFGDSLTALYNAPLKKKDVWKVLSEDVDKFN